MRHFRLHLVYPTTRVYRRHRWKNLVPPFNLALLAANCPPEVEVKISDTYLAPLDYDWKADLVGITALTPTAMMTYRHAERFREMGVPVVLGGIHPSALPEEGLQHANAVVSGEAEGGAWQDVLADAMAGKLSGVYTSAEKPSLSQIKDPRWDLLDLDRYFIKNMMETSRGCPFDCMFCTDSIVFGETYRFRPVEEVVDALKRSRRRFVFFIDDNIVGNHRRAKQLFEALIPLKIRWVGQATINFAKDDELVELMAKSGCVGFLTGLESANYETLKRVGKAAYRPDKVKEWIAKVQAHGMFVQGEFIFGFDEDDPGVFQRTVDFAHDIGVSSARFAILKPYPGTRLFKQLEAEDRLLTTDWARFHTEHVVFQPKLMTPEQLAAGRDWAYQQFAKFPSILRRVSLSKKNAWLAFAVNVANSSFKNSRDPKARREQKRRAREMAKIAREQTRAQKMAAPTSA